MFSKVHQISAESLRFQKVYNSQGGAVAVLAIDSLKKSKKVHHQNPLKSIEVHNSPQKCKNSKKGKKVYKDIQKSDNLQHNQLARWGDGANNSSTKRLMFSHWDFLILIPRLILTRFL